MIWHGLTQRDTPGSVAVMPRERQEMGLRGLAYIPVLVIIVCVTCWENIIKKEKKKSLPNLGNLSTEVEEKENSLIIA